MSVIIILIVISVLVAGGFLTAFFWAVKSGQYDDILEKAKEISGIDYKAFTEVDHYHVNLAERSKK